MSRPSSARKKTELKKLRFGQWLDYQDVQDLVYGYLRSKPKLATAMLSMRVQNSESNYQGCVRAVDKCLQQMKDRLLKSPRFYSRIPLPLALGGHFGYCVIEPSTNSMVISEPMGSEGYQKRLNDYILLIRKYFPDIKIISAKDSMGRPTKLNLQQDGNLYDCGPISAKTIGYLCTTKKSLTDALDMRKSSKELNQLMVGNEDDRSRALYHEQCALRANLEQEKENRNYRRQYQKLINALQINKRISSLSGIYTTLDRAFSGNMAFSPDYYLQDSNNIATGNYLRDLIENYLTEETDLLLLDKNERTPLLSEMNKKYENKFRQLIPMLVGNYDNNMNSPIIADPQLPNTTTISLDTYKAALRRQIEHYSQAESGIYMGDSNMATLTHKTALKKMLAILENQSTFNLTSDEIQSLRADTIGIATYKAWNVLPAEYRTIKTAITNLIVDLNSNVNKIEAVLVSTEERGQLHTDQLANIKLIRAMRGEVAAFELNEIASLCQPELSTIAQHYPQLPKLQLIMDLAAYINRLQLMKNRRDCLFQMPDIDNKVDLGMKVLNTIASQMATGEKAIEITRDEYAIYQADIKNILDSHSIALPRILITPAHCQAGLAHVEEFKSSSLPSIAIGA